MNDLSRRVWSTPAPESVARLNIEIRNIDNNLFLFLILSRHAQDLWSIKRLSIISPAANIGSRRVEEREAEAYIKRPADKWRCPLNHTYAPLVNCISAPPPSISFRSSAYISANLSLNSAAHLPQKMPTPSSLATLPIEMLIYSSLVTLPNEIFAIIFDLIDLRAIHNYASNYPSVAPRIMEYTVHRFHNLTQPWFPDATERLRDNMRECRSIIGGSAALSFFVGGGSASAFRPSNLEIYASLSSDDFHRFSDFLLGEDYCIFEDTESSWQRQYHFRCLLSLLLTGIFHQHSLFTPVRASNDFREQSATGTSASSFLAPGNRPRPQFSPLIGQT